MGEKAEVCGADCCKSATPARNDLSVPRFTHHPYCHVAGGYLDAQKTCHLGNVGESVTWNLGKPTGLLNDEWTGHETV